MRISRTYHQRIAQEKRALIVTAATALFLELGYDRTSLARIAERSGVAQATLFKQFPTKVDEAVRTIAARYTAIGPGPTTDD
ncbi:hypothetical protein GCM10027598_45820 [Amycolatopsis oliviviridis]|uniref:HTH tetR-type domain-containing protein n=1 Tax=Amycolatopsis oliviviridis TaxID=1471590 RepID=A0ABQ3L8M3_9PSEU|nr:helix-turn-helix domain-containing protein [Amycolatopsis oliviviridis]GHH08796.1 hypothetical protein GCM10017790_16020 [Amycolatopsis oliviviridis]